MPLADQGMTFEQLISQELLDIRDVEKFPAVQWTLKINQ